MKTSGVAACERNPNHKTDRFSLQALLKAMLLSGVAALVLSKPAMAQEAGAIQLNTIEVQTSGGTGPRIPVKGYISDYSRAAT